MSFRKLTLPRPGGLSIAHLNIPPSHQEQSSAGWGGPGGGGGRWGGGGAWGVGGGGGEVGVSGVRGVMGG